MSVLILFVSGRRVGRPSVVNLLTKFVLRYPVTGRGHFHRKTLSRDPVLLLSEIKSCGSPSCRSDRQKPLQVGPWSRATTRVVEGKGWTSQTLEGHERTGLGKLSSPLSPCLSPVSSPRFFLRTTSNVFRSGSQIDTPGQGTNPSSTVLFSSTGYTPSFDNDSGPSTH